MIRDRLRSSPGLVVGAIGVAAFVAAMLAVLAGSGLDLPRALGALAHGALGSAYAVHSATLVRATPLLLTGLAITVAFTAGVLNIGAEGQFLMGAAAATAVALALAPRIGGGAIPVALLAGALAGSLLAGLAAWLRLRFGVLEVISTILLNFVAIHFVGYLVRGPMQEATRVYPQSSTLPAAVHLPLLASGSRLHGGFLVAIAACVSVWVWLRFTAGGFRLRAVGANANGARVAGQIDVARVTTGAFLLSGGLAGLAGGIEVCGVTYALYDNLSPGYGFTAIAVALLAQLQPLAVIVTGIFFGGLEAGGAAMQRDAGVPSVLVAVIEATIILLIVAIRGGRLRGERSRRRERVTPSES